MSNNELIQALQKFCTGDVYLLSPKSIFLEGYQNYCRKMVKSFQWKAKGTTLLARVEDGLFYSVSFFIDGAQLRFACSCMDWNPASHCPHVICSIITIKNILDEKHFSDTRVGADYRGRLAGMLMAFGRPAANKPVELKKSSHEPGFSIALRGGAYSWSSAASVCKDGRHISIWRNDVPYELHDLIIDSNRHYPLYGRDKSKDVLWDYLKKYGNSHPLFLAIDERNIPVKWDPDLKFITRVELDAGDDRVILDLRFFSDDGGLKKPYLLNANLVIDVESRRVGSIAGKEGLKLWRDMSELFRPLKNMDMISKGAGQRLYGFITPHSTKLENFHDAQLKIDKKNLSCLDSILFKVKGEEAGLKKSKNGYSIVIDEDPQRSGNILLKCFCNTGRPKVAFSHTFFANQIEIGV